jgi:nicotinamidase-related amidase
VARAGLIVTDMLNRYDHEDAGKLRESARTVVPVLRDLIDEWRRRDDFLVFVNDNHGDWTAGRGALTRKALEGESPELVEPIAPDRHTPFLVKARHSAFYATQLEHLLHEEGVDRIVVTGQVTEQCVLYTALDAYIRGLGVTIPRDAVAHIHQDLAEAALRMMETNMRADIVDAGAALDSLSR